MNRTAFINGLEDRFARLKECARKYNCGDEPIEYFEAERLTFVEHIDLARKTDWFIMPKRGRIFNTYYNVNLMI